MAYNYLYGLTIQGIQSYIFATNKLKEIAGGSEIIEQMCTTWFNNFLTVNELSGIKQLNAAGNIRFLTDKDTVKKIFKEYQNFLLTKAPGVPYSQAVVEIDDGKEYEAIQMLDAKLRAQRNLPLYETDLGLTLRSKFRRSGDFAVTPKIDGGDKKYYDLVTKAKFDNRDATALTKKTNIEIDEKEIIYPKEFSEIAKDAKHSWLAVIHIDGNSMGLKIKSILDTAKHKFSELNNFSNAINDCTLNAYKIAVKKVFANEGKVTKNREGKDVLQLPMRPIILGGDDVTVIIRADLAIEFTKVYLKTFDEETSKNDLTKGMTAAAGIAFVKEKFPFHYSAELAEDLCVYAKNKSKRKFSCLHFYKVQDSIIEDYKEIIKRELTAADGTEFINGPYALKNINDTSNIDNLLLDIKKLKDEDSPKNVMREWTDAKFNQPQIEKILMERLKNKATKDYKNIIKNTDVYIDYHTLLAVNTKTETI